MARSGAAGQDKSRRERPAKQYRLAGRLLFTLGCPTTNIAEGHARDSTKEFLYHVSVAMSSLAEVETQLLLAREFGYSSQREVGELLTALDRIVRMLRGLKKSQRAKLL